MNLCKNDSTRCTLLENHPGPCTPWTGWHNQSGVRPADIHPQAAKEAANYWWNIRLDQIWTKEVPPRFANARFDTLDLPTDITNQLRSWIDLIDNLETNGNLLLFGPVGAGKTWTATAVLHELHDGYSTFRHTRVVDIFNRLRPDGTGDINDYINTDTLLIDDLGIAKMSEWTEEILFTIIDDRWRNERPTIITSNLTPDELRATVGLRIYDRLRDNALALVLTGPSRRKGTLSTRRAA